MEQILDYKLTIGLKHRTDDKTINDKLNELVIQRMSRLVEKVAEIEDVELATLSYPGQRFDEDPVDLLEL